jgi:RNA polymerase sigma-70 factor (ECF subfamily)
VATIETLWPRLAATPAATEAEWEALYEVQLPRVYNFFRYRVGCTADVEDLTAITFEKAWKNRHRYRRDLAGFTTWLLTIARNVAIDHFRKQPIEMPLDAVERFASTGRTPEQALSDQRNRERLAALLAQLPEREREIVALKFGAGMTNRTIAKVTGLSESNVGTILHRTVQELRRSW